MAISNIFCLNFPPKTNGPKWKTSLKTPLQQITSNDEEQLHIPDVISCVLKSEIIQKLSCVGIEDRQQLVDELVGRMAISKVKKILNLFVPI